MRATQSHDTVLTDAFVPDDRVVLTCPTGMAGAQLFHGPLFAWALLGFAAVYAGAARRALDLTLASASQRTSLELTRTMAYHPEIQHGVADMRIALDAATTVLRANARDWSDGVAHEDWPIRLIGTRHFVINQAYAIVDRALELSGGSGVFKHNRLEQLFRDVRMGRFHPPNDMMTHELIGKMCLGVDPDDPQRWG
jgi:alkylation response protein AidB-like acyl-CoA dehydrogenase